MEAIIRERTGRVLDELPRNETFDWVDRVSIELTTHDARHAVRFPVGGRRKLTCWSDVAIANVNAPERRCTPRQERFAELQEMADVLHGAVERAGERSRRSSTCISMLAHGEATRDMPLMRVHGQR